MGSSLSTQEIDTQQEYYRQQRERQIRADEEQRQKQRKADEEEQRQRKRQADEQQIQRQRRADEEEREKERRRIMAILEARRQAEQLRKLDVEKQRRRRFSQVVTIDPESKINLFLLSKIISEMEENLDRLIRISNKTRIFNTNLTGRFVCRKGKKICSRWTSGKVYTEISLEDDCFDLDVYDQICKKCGRAGTFEPDIDVYIDRILSKIMLMLNLRDPYLRDNDDDGKHTPPHIKELCSACLAGKDHVFLQT